MPSPFPGMDPYLEEQWDSVHVLLIAALAAVLKRVLPPGLQARPERQVMLETRSGERLGAVRRPDVSVAGRRGAGPRGGARKEPGGVASTIEPVMVDLDPEPPAFRDIRIVDARDDARLVTAVEVLSPWNKRAGDANEQYRRKLRDFDRAGVSWVEIDLLRGSRRHLDVTWDHLPEGRQSRYMIAVRRSGREAIAAYPFSLRDPLPVVPVPLREGDEDVPLDLPAAMARVYDDGPFDDIDYARPTRPALRGADARWVAEHLAAAGLS